jgi:hypothetical protein
MDLGWVFLILCPMMMVLCFLMMGRRAATGGCINWCQGNKRQARKHRSAEVDTTGEETALRNKADRLDTWKGDTVPPVVPR